MIKLKEAYKPPKVFMPVYSHGIRNGFINHLSAINKMYIFSEIL